MSQAGITPFWLHATLDMILPQRSMLGVLDHEKLIDEQDQPVHILNKQTS